MRLRISLFVLVLLAAGCRQKEGGLDVEVQFKGFTPGCFTVHVDDGNGHEGTTTVTVRQARSHFVGIAMGSGWSRRWSMTVTALETCAGARVVAEAHEDGIDVPLGEPVKKTYELSATDFDSDGYVALDGGGTDCDDGKAAVSPGLGETCSDGLDNDCKNGVDCADVPGCGGQPCDDGDACTTPDACANGACGGPPRDCGPSPMTCHADAGACALGACTWPPLPINTPCGTGLACNSSAACVPASSELNCADGLDDDGDDAGIDCADSDCNTFGCDAGLCVVGATCGGGVCAGQSKPCSAPALCRDAGVCNPSTGACDYAPSASGAPCSADSCRVGQTCDGIGTCGGGSAMTCLGSGPCVAGACDAGSCVLTPLSAGSCDDDAGCTHTDTCANGVCTGTSFSCSPAPACRSGGACEGDGGCTFAPDPSQNGQGCGDGGVCAGGQCLDFPYVVSNVSPAALPPSTARVRINCPVTFDSTDGGVTGNWCGSPPPNVYFVTQQGSSEPAAVLSMRSFELDSDGGVLRLIGSRPVILLVFDKGTTPIDGTLDARSLLAVPGAGGNRGSCGLQVGGTGTASARPTEEVGSGGGGGGLSSRGGWGGTSVWTVTVAGADGGTSGPSGREPLVGGCSGGRGGLTIRAPQTPCNGGAGGGAVQLSVAGVLRVAPTAVLTVSGGGGSSPPMTTAHGGCGGGSGGVLLLEGNALNLMAGAWLTANGGGGSEGADYQVTTPDRGDDGEAASATPAPGGSGGAAYAGEGGNGGAGSTGPTSPGPDYVGGGGGGAMGFIHLRAASACAHLANFSPTLAADAGCP